MDCEGKVLFHCVEMYTELIVTVKDFGASLKLSLLV